MLRIQVKLAESFNSETSEFEVADSIELLLEHSLVSVSKWESKWKVPFLSSKEKSTDQVLDYIRAMIVGEEPDPGVISKLSDENIQEIIAYIDDKPTATWFNEQNAPKKPGSEIVTAELIYYWMTLYNIWMECENWHLDRLMTLIRVCNYKSSPARKMSRAEAGKMQRDLNAERKARMGTKG